MKILLVTPSYYPHVGGVEYVVKSIAERLTKIGYKVVVLTGEPSAREVLEGEINGVNVVRWPTRTPSGAYHIPIATDKLRKTAIHLAKDADVVHIHNIHAVFSVYVLKFIRDVKTWKVITPYYHGTGHTPIRKLLWIPWRRYLRKLVTVADVIHTVSKLEANLIRRDFSREAIPIENGVEGFVKAMSWNPENYVMYSGRIEKYKNINLLAKIVKLLNMKYKTELTLKIFGNGPYKQQLLQTLKRLELPFEIEDFQPFNQYIQALAHATLFGLLSQKESYPQTINEANAIGVPALTALPWGRNFEGRTRILIIDPTQDVKKIADEVYQYLQKAPHEPEQCPHLG